MLGYDPEGERGIDRRLPDHVTVIEPKDTLGNAIPGAQLAQALKE